MPSNKRKGGDLAVKAEDVPYFHGPERSPHANYVFLVGHFPEGTWGSLPLRLQVCLGFSKWLIYPGDKEKTLELYDLLKQWRKVERRVGGKRTALERLFRQHVLRIVRELRSRRSQSRKSLKRIARGEWNLQEYNNQRKNLRTLHQYSGKAQNMENRGGEWILFSPIGEVFYIKSLRKFCGARGFDWSHLSRTSTIPGKFYKGWRAVKRTPIVEWWGPKGFG